MQLKWSSLNTSSKQFLRFERVIPNILSFPAWSILIPLLTKVFWLETNKKNKQKRYKEPKNKTNQRQKPHPIHPHTHTQIPHTCDFMFKNPFLLRILLRFFLTCLFRFKNLSLLPFNCAISPGTIIKNKSFEFFIVSKYLEFVEDVLVTSRSLLF